MRRIGTWAAAIVLGAGVLAGCGGDDSSDGGSDQADGGGGSYCDRLQGFQDTLENTQDAASFEKFKEAAEELADEAPGEVADAWNQIEEAFDQLESKLEAVGLDLDDLDDPSALQSADPEAMATLQEEFAAIGENLDKAGDKISEHAKSECDIDLGGNESPSPSS